MKEIKLPKRILKIRDIKSNNDIILNNNNNELKKFFEKKNLKEIVNNSQIKINKKDTRKSKTPHIPDLADLYIIYNLIFENNRINILEYGTGWSSIIILKALNDLKIRNKNEHYTRVSKPYSLTIVDDSKYFMKISKKRILKYFKNINNLNMCFSEASMQKLNDRYITLYDKHPVINPDLIYIDGPSQWNIKGRINNFTVNNFEMMPMMADILAYEYYLTPGTIILCDGRTNNINYLRDNFKRKWLHKHLKWADMHVLYLKEKALGVWNKEQLKFYKKKKF